MMIVQIKRERIYTLVSHVMNRIAKSVKTKLNSTLNWQRAYDMYEETGMKHCRRIIGILKYLSNSQKMETILKKPELCLSAKEKRLKVLLIDNDDFSDYTCYLARGLSKYVDVILCCFSEKSPELTGAAKHKEIKIKYINNSWEHLEF